MLTMERKELEGALRTVCRVARKSGLPVEEACLLCASEEGLTLRAQTSDVQCTLYLPCVAFAYRSWSTCVVAHRLLDGLRSLRKAADDVRLFLEEGELRLEGLHFAAPCATREFPSLVELPTKNGEFIELQEDFGEAAAYVLPAVDSSSSFGYTANILLDFRNGRMVGSDRRRLHCAVLGAPVKRDAVLVSPEALRVARPTHLVLPAMGSKHVHLLLENGYLTTPVRDGKFPPYEDVIPKKPACSFIVERGALLDAVQQALTVADRELHACRFDLDGQIRMSVREKTSVVFETSFPGRVQGKAMQVRFNLTYLRDAVRGWSDDEVLVQLTSAVGTGVFRNQDGTRLALVMPLNVEK